MVAWILKLLDSEMPQPQPYGWFHLLWLALTVAAPAWLCACG